MQAVILLFMAAFLLAGLWYRRPGSPAPGDTSTGAADFHLAGRSIPGWVGGLTAAATSNSGFMFTGMIYVVLTLGLAWAWLLIGWTIGAGSAWFLAYPRLKERADSQEATSLTQVVLNGAHGPGKKYLAPALSVVVAILLGIYASGQLVAARVTVEAVLPEQSWLYALAAFGVMLIYSSVGGLRSTVYSDVLQGSVMVIAVVLLNVYLLAHVLSSEACRANFSSLAEAGFFNMRYGSGLPSTLLFVVGWLLGGASELAQPHVMVRVLALKSHREVRAATATYLAWFSTLSLLVVSFGVLARVAQPTLTALPDELAQETAFALVALELLPPWLIGVVIAGFLAATVSTADSQILAASAAITDDWKHHRSLSRRVRGGVTAAVGLAALLSYLVVSWISPTVYSIITLAWALIAAAFFPPVLFTLLNRSYPTWGLALSVCGGIVATVIWKSRGLDSVIYEVAPGVVIALVVLLTASTISRVSSGRA